MAQHKGEEIYVQDKERMVTIKHTANRVYFTGYCMFEGEWSYSWIIETTRSDVHEFGREEI